LLVTTDTLLYGCAGRMCYTDLTTKRSFLAFPDIGYFKAVYLFIINNSKFVALASRGKLILVGI